MLAVLALAALAADSRQPHYHRGKLSKYEIGPPSVLLSRNDEKRLKSGKPVMQAVVADDGLTRRMLTVMDIPVPSSIVLGRIMDIDRYPDMVSGVENCASYATDEAKDGVRTVKSTYEIKALHLKLKYFIEHTYDPKAGCMTFCLDYDRRSDLDDSVGYWYVEPTGRSTSRVFYSCECKLRGWVPPPVYNLLTKEALKKATVWVNDESLKEWRTRRAGVANDPFLTFVDNVRESYGNAVEALDLPNMRLPRLPRPRRAAAEAADWLDSRKRDAVHFMSGGGLAGPGRRATPRRAAPQPSAEPEAEAAAAPDTEGFMPEEPLIEPESEA